MVPISNRFLLSLSLLAATACVSGGGASRSDDEGAGQQSGNNDGPMAGGGSTEDGEGVTPGAGTPPQSGLEARFPVAQNAALPTRIDQSFVCIDSIELAYYEVVFAPGGTATLADGSGDFDYAVQGQALDLDLTRVLGPGAGYRHALHVTAGDLVVGFVGEVTAGAESAVLACIAARHDFSDAVPSQTTILCEGASTDGGFSNSATNRFTLEPNHYAQRYFNDTTYVSFDGVDAPPGISTSSELTQHGTYLYDASEGVFVMGFLKVDPATDTLDVEIFEGISNGSEVEVSVGGNSQGCRFE